MAVANLRRQCPRRFTKHREVIGDCLLSRPVVLEAFLVALRQIADVRERGAHVCDAVNVSARAQSEMASFSICSRVCSRA